MLDLNDFFLLVQVVDRGGFTAAGRTLGMPKSTLSHRIQQLETDLGVRLINRTSRRFGMTEAGQEFYRHAVAMLHEAERAETAIRHRLSEPIGAVRCTAGVATMQFAMPGVLADFLVRYPKVNVVAHSTDRYVDIVGELRRRSASAFRSTSGFEPGATYASAGTMVSLRGLSISRRRRTAGNTPRSSEMPLPVHDANWDPACLASTSFEQNEE